jgi:hypothetical protein
MVNQAYEPGAAPGSVHEPIWRIDAGAPVWLTTSTPDIAAGLARFYPVAPVPAAGPGLIIRAAVGAPGPESVLDQWGVGYHAEGAVLNVVGPNCETVVIAAREAAREALVVAAERAGYAMLHAAAVMTTAGQVVVLVGASGAGKTTLALRAVVDHGASLVANDHLLIADRRSGLELCTLPTPVPVRTRTWHALADRLPDPWDHNGQTLQDLDGDGSVYFANAQLAMFPRWLPARDAVVVVLDGIVAAPSPTPVKANDPAAAVWPHVRHGWVFDPARNTNHLGASRRSRPQYTSDARDRVGELVTESSTVVVWRHSLDPAPLGTLLNGGAW